MFITTGHCYLPLCRYRKHILPHVLCVASPCDHTVYSCDSAQPPQYKLSDALDKIGSDMKLVSVIYQFHSPGPRPLEC